MQSIFCYVKKLCLLLTAGCLAVTSAAQDRRPTTTPSTLPPITPPGTTPSSFRTGPKPYKDIITEKAITKKGLFHVHRIDDKWFF